MGKKRDDSVCRLRPSYSFIFPLFLLLLLLLQSRSSSSSTSPSHFFPPSSSHCSSLQLPPSLPSFCVLLALHLLPKILPLLFPFRCHK